MAASLTLVPGHLVCNVSIWITNHNEVHVSYTSLPSMNFIFFGSSIVIVCWRIVSLDLVTPEGLQLTSSSVEKTHSISFSAAMSGLLASLALASLSGSQTIPYKYEGISTVDVLYT